jgi:hypothetical protein
VRCNVNYSSMFDEFIFSCVVYDGYVLYIAGRYKITSTRECSYQLGYSGQHHSSSPSILLVLTSIRGLRLLSDTRPWGRWLSSSLSDRSPLTHRFLGQQVRLVWKYNWGIGTILFLLTRYLSFVDVPLTAWRTSTHSYFDEGRKFTSNMLLHAVHRRPPPSPGVSLQSFGSSCHSTHLT